MREESGESQRNKRAGLPPPPPLPVEVGGGALGKQGTPTALT